MIWLAISFAVLLVMGVPVAFAIGLSSCAFFLAEGLPMPYPSSSWPATS